MDTLFHNAHVYDSTGRHLGNCLLARAGRIDSIACLDTLPDETSLSMVDLGGGIVLPAFWDCHVHLTELGFLELGPDLSNTRTVTDLLQAISRQARGFGGDLLRITGFDPTQITDRLPTLDELDEACPCHPLLLSHVEWHACWLNRRALSLTGLLSCDGFLTGEQNSLARQRLGPLVSTSERRQAIECAAGLLASRGIAGVHALEGGVLFSDEDFDLLMQMRGDLPVLAYPYYQVLDADAPRARQAGRVGGCVPLDGSSGVYTAAISEPYLGGRGLGVLYYSQEQVDWFVRRAGELGLQTSLHACGDRAIEQVLSAHQKAPSPALRHRIEHVELPRPDQLERLADMDLVASLQPAFDHLWGGDDKDYALTLGNERARQANPLRSLLSLGARLILGSDAPVTPANPMLILQSAMTHTRPIERISFWDAVPLLTRNAAWAVHQEQSHGDICRGKSADFTVYCVAPWLIKPENLKSVLPEMTVVNGRVVYDRREAAVPAR